MRSVNEMLKALSYKGWLVNLATGQGKTGVYAFRSQLRSYEVSKLEGSKTDEIRLKEPISEDFLNLVTSHFLEMPLQPHTQLPSCQVEVYYCIS